MPARLESAQPGKTRLKQNHNTIKLVAMDFDLTLYDHTDPSATLNLQACFERLDRLGVKLGLASGRSIDELRQPLDEIGFAWGCPFPHFVICHEGEIYQPDGTTTSQANIWNVERGNHVQHCNDLVNDHFQELVSWAASEHHQILRAIRVGSHGTNVVFETPEIAEIARTRLANRLTDQPEIEVNRNHHIVTALPKCASKGSALAQLAFIDGCKPNEVLAIGDNGNDISMLCGQFRFNAALVGNASHALKQMVIKNGGYVARQNISEGVLEILNHHFA